MVRTIIIVVVLLLLRLLSPSAPAEPSHQPGRHPDRDSGLLPWIEPFGTFCGMVGLRAKVLGWGCTCVPHQRECALSCSSLAIYGPGRSNALTSALRFAPPQPPKTALGFAPVLAHNTRRYGHPLAGVPGLSGWGDGAR
jgi:hypothetical protein